MGGEKLILLLAFSSLFPTFLFANDHTSNDLPLESAGGVRSTQGTRHVDETRRTPNFSTTISQGGRSEGCRPKNLSRNNSQLSTEIPKGTKLSDPKVQEAVKMALSRGNRIVIYANYSLHEDIFSLGWDANGHIRLIKQYGIDPQQYGDVPSEDYVIKENLRISKNPQEVLDEVTLDAIRESTPHELTALEGARDTIHKADIAVTKHIPYLRRIPFVNGYPITNNCWADAEGTWNQWHENMRLIAEVRSVPFNPKPAF